MLIAWFVSHPVSRPLLGESSASNQQGLAWLDGAYGYTDAVGHHQVHDNAFKESADKLGQDNCSEQGR